MSLFLSVRSRSKCEQDLLKIIYEGVSGHFGYLGFLTCYLGGNLEVSGSFSGGFLLGGFGVNNYSTIRL